MSKIKLTPQDRDFFRLVSHAAAINPFSDERRRIDEQISGIHATDDRRQRVLYAVEAIRQQLGK